MGLKTGMNSFLILILCTEIITSAPSEQSAKCLKANGEPILRFEVIPGGGWDNLRNLDMGKVMDISYSHCQTTEDGKYLMPDDMEVLPVKSSNIETYAQTFEHWDKYTSSLSASINAHGKGIVDDFIGIHASFSSEFEEVKTHQYFDNSFTTRTQVRYSEYTAKLKIGSKLSHEFKSRLRKIAALHTLNDTDSARYESQLLVRDYGTHVITSIKVGAMISQTDNFHRSSSVQSEADKTAIRAAAGASFFSLFDFGVSSSVSTSSSDASALFQTRTSSKVEAHGGPRFRPKNFSAAEWSDGLDDNLVAIDRDGDPIYLFVNDETLPNVPSSILFHVYTYVREAVNVYYKHNTYFGCTQRDSPNFCFTANADDGTCKHQGKDFSFGGAYQTCVQSGSNLENVCTDMSQTNPLTNDFSCPDGYESVKLQEGSKTVVFTHRDCHRCWAFFHCCKDNPYSAFAQYTTYSCVASGTPASRLLFGGTYTDQVANVFTQSKSCPKNFEIVKLLEDLYICISNDFDTALEYSLPFGGFFSCISGNPLANSVMGCPTGYSQHLAANDRGCDIHFCLKSSVVASMSFPGVNLPPYSKAPKESFLHAKTTSYVLSRDGEVWTEITGEEQSMPASLLSFIPVELISTSTGTSSTPLNWISHISSKVDSSPVTSTTVSTKMPNEPSTLSSSSSMMDDSHSPTGNGVSVVGIVSISVGSTLVCIGLVFVAYRVYRRGRPLESYAQI